MKRTKIWCIFLCAALFLASAVGLTATALAQESAGAAETEYIVGEGGIAVTDSLVGGVNFSTKADMTQIPDSGTTYGKTILAMLSVKFSEPVNATASGGWDGFLIRMKNTTASDLRFNAYLCSGNDLGRNYNGAINRYEVFTDAEGADQGAASQGILTKTGYYTLTGGADGTWNYKMSEIIVNRTKMTAVDQIAFGLRMSDKDMSGKGVVIGSISVYKADAASATGYTVKTLFHSDGLTVTEDAAEETAGLNLADYEKGTLVNMTLPCINNTGSFVKEEYRADLKAQALANVSVSLQGCSFTVNYLDEAGETLLPKLSKTYRPGEPYEITPPVIEGYLFKSADAELSGTANDDMIFNLTYKVDDTDPPRVATEVEYAVSGGGIQIKDKLFGGIRMTTKADMETIPDDAATYGKTILGMVKFNLTQLIDGTSATEWDGFLIRMKNTSSKDLKFNTHLLSNGQVGRNYVSSDVRSEIFIDENGSDLGELALGITTAKGYQTISGNASGTWNYRFADLKHNRAEMGAIEALMFGLRLGEKGFAGYGLVIGAISVYKEDASSDTGYMVKTLFNAKDLIVSEDASDETADFNFADTDLGNVVTTDCPCVNNTGSFVAEQYREELHAKALAGLTLELQGYTVTINYLDEEGDSLAPSVNENYKKDQPYTITPKAISGYEYLSADIPLTGTVTDDMVIRLTYRLQSFKITVKFVDEEGNKIRDDAVQSAFLQDYVTLDVAEFGEIEGYEFKESKDNLKFTVMKDTEVTLVYAKKKRSGPNMGVIIGCSVGGIVLVAGAIAGVVVYKKKKGRKAD